MTTLKERMPTLARVEGIWEGSYRYLDAAGKLVDEHRSRLICRFPDDGPYPYHQTNHYLWPDGRSEVRDFPAVLRDGRLCWHGEAVSGWAAELAEDPGRRTLLLHWSPLEAEDEHIYEMMQISDCGQFRSRVAQWLAAGRLKLRILVDEERVASDWR